MRNLVLGVFFIALVVTPVMAFESTTDLVVRSLYASQQVTSSVQTKRALDITTRAFARSVDFTSDTTTSTRDKFKLVHAAKSDAAAYVASDGAIQGVYLTRAVAFIRSEYPAACKLNDLELAKAILSIK